MSSPRYCALLLLKAGCLAITFLAAPPNLSAAQGDLFQVGLARVDITPSYPIRLNGFGFRRAESEGVSQRIYARALAISRENQSPFVLLAIDSLGVRMPMVDALAARLKKSHGLPRANVALTFTHSHCAPKVNGASDNIFSQPMPAAHQKHIDRYSAELLELLTKAAKQALDSRQPSRLEWNQGRVGFAKNRRTAGGPVDHDLPVLIVRNPNNGQVRGVYVSYACHCVTLSFNQISGDWAGYAAEMIERAVPDAIAMVSIGCGSDSNPDSGVTGDKTDVAARQGAEIASEVQRILKSKNRPLSGKLAAKLNAIQLPFLPIPSVEQFEALAKKGGPAGYNASTQLAKINSGKTIPKSMTYPIQSWTFGDDLCIVFLAGEVCVDYSLRLKKELRRDRIWLNGYSNDFCSYIPSERLVREGGYGGGAEIPYFALPTKLAAGLEQPIIDEVLRQTPKAFRAVPGTQGVPPKSPQESLRCLNTHSDLQVELVASEPFVTDPVAIDFGPDGRVWVAEMNDYGQGVAAKFKHSGRVRCLIDSNDDGRFDRVQTFLDGLRFPTDVKVWRNGLLVCDAPDILFAQDTTGDGVADIKRTLFSGFAVHNAQARVNSLRFGLDNWIHGSCGLFGGAIHSHKTGKTVDVSNRDFRLNPDSGEIQAASGRTQQGRCRNDWGDWFGCSNSNLLFQHVGEARYAGRNTYVAPPTPSSNVGDAIARRLFHGDNLVRFKLTGPPGQATSACGLGIYRDTELGEAYQGNGFTCEPVHQLVHRMVLKREGVEYSGARGGNETDREFLSSTDPWFRPVQVRTAPDGSLWVVDMYRYVIEHARWIPPETLAKLDIYAGQGRGRIYRVKAKADPKVHVAPPRLANVANVVERDGAELVQLLEHPNGVVRDLAHQQLIWRTGSPPLNELKETLRESKSPLAKIHAMSVLSYFRLLPDELILLSLESAHVEVIRHAMRHSESRLDVAPKIMNRVCDLAGHEDSLVRRQAAWSLGQSKKLLEHQARVLRSLLADSEPRVRAAALSSLNKNNIAAVASDLLTASGGSSPVASTEQATLFRLAVHWGDSTLLDRVMERVLPTEQALREGKLPGLDEAGLCVATSLALQSRDDQQARSARAKWAPRYSMLHARAADLLGSSTDDSVRLAALAVLQDRPDWIVSEFGGQGEPATAEDALDTAIADAIAAANGIAVQQSAVRALANRNSTGAAQRLVRRLPYASGEVRLSILDALLAREKLIPVLLDGLQHGAIPASTLDAIRRQRLLTHKSEKVRKRAAKVLASSDVPSSRSAVLKKYQTQIGTLEGQAEAGRSVFRKHCSACHRVNNHGFEVGPNLAALTNLSAPALLQAILNPNQAVDARYVSWTAIRDDGRSVSGVLVAETPVSITLREAGGKNHVILRRELEELRSQGKSTMPEGLERDITAQDMSHLVSYLQQLERPPKAMPGNRPQRIAATGSREFSLLASQGEVRGGSIVFEQPFQNIGHWHAEQDRVTWRVELSQGGPFDVYLQLSCANESAGNRFRLEGVNPPIRGVAPATGGWDRFQALKIGQANLSAGTHVITLRPDAPLRRALFDLREVRFVPAGKTTVFKQPAAP